MKRLADWLSLVRFSHSVFALPFALCGAWLAAGGVPPARTLLLVVLCAVAAMVDPDYRGRGMSRAAVRAMVDLARANRLGGLIAPVRPTRKSAYPLAPMERYVRWENADGLPLDPWIRVHARMGAELLAVAPRTMVIEGTVAEWERWTDMPFPDSGAYVVPGALQPVVIDREQDVGRYEDPNVWMRHCYDISLVADPVASRHSP